jgi:hypothetical protein
MRIQARFRGSESRILQKIMHNYSWFRIFSNSFYTFHAIKVLQVIKNIFDDVIDFQFSLKTHRSRRISYTDLDSDGATDYGRDSNEQYLLTIDP